MRRNETALPRVTAKRARRDFEKPDEEPSTSRPHSTRARRGPFPCRSLRALVRQGLLRTFLDLGGAPVSLADARARRVAALLADEEPADVEQERRARNDRPRGAA